MSKKKVSASFSLTLDEAKGTLDMIPEKEKKRSFVAQLKGRIPQWFVDALDDYVQQTFSNNIIHLDEEREGDLSDVSV